MGKRICLISCGAPHIDVRGTCSARMTKTRWHDADDGVSVAVEIDTVSQYVWISAKQSVPGCVADHAGIGKAKGFILGAKDTSKLRRNSENREIAGTAGDQLDPLRMIPASKVRADRPCR